MSSSLSLSTRLIRRAVRGVALAALVGAPAQVALFGQVPTSANVPAVAPTAGSTGVSPGGAFLRAVAVPGWGHAAIGAWGRAGFYFLAESATAYGLIRTRLRLGDARSRADFRDGVLRQDAAAQGLSGEELDEFLDQDDVLDDLRGLVGAREGQQEDWIALGIFLVFLSGADAYVSAHLRDFPEPLNLDAMPTPDGRVELSLSVGWPGR